MKLSKGDTVQVISGKDKGKKGSILRVLMSESRVIVSGINIITRHIKKTAQSEGRKVTYESSIHASKVMILDPKTGKPTRIGYKVDPKTGKKERIAKGSGVAITRTKMEAPKAKDKVGSVAPASDKKPAAKGPFWKKMGFGADAAGQAGEGGKVESGAATPAAQTHSRSGSRGS